MDVETEIKEIKEGIREISRKLDELIHEKEAIAIMKLSEKSLEFLKEEPDIYSISDLKVKYK